MSTGSRSRSGCLTCRIRKKKCDGQRPSCRACSTRQLTCYGYSSPPPAWYVSKRTWDDVKNSDEAKTIRSLAELHYHVQRKFDAQDSEFDPATASTAPLITEGETVSATVASAADTRIQGRRKIAPNTWQLYPESLWWDSMMSSLTTDLVSSRKEDTKHLMLFVEVIHPITHTFTKIVSNGDRGWLLNRLLSDRSLYCAALSTSVCFENSLSHAPRKDNIGIDLRVQNLQNKAIGGLHTRIIRFMELQKLNDRELVCTGIDLVDVMLNLLNLEVFSRLEGVWEAHYKAAITVMNHVENYLQGRTGMNEGHDVSLIQFCLGDASSSSGKRRSLEFSITNFVWIDVIARATFGLRSYEICVFDYLESLEDGTIRTEAIMGCQGWVMALIFRIAKLEEWITSNTDRLHEHDTLSYVSRCRGKLLALLEMQAQQLEVVPEQEHNELMDDWQEDIRQVTIIWVHAAQIFLKVCVSSVEPALIEDVHNKIGACLNKMESLPARLFMRVHWPYTIAGCTSTSETQHQKFRRLFARTMQQSQPPGVTWKGLLVMEECWRLRDVRGWPGIGWREAMISLNARILLV